MQDTIPRLDTVKVRNYGVFLLLLFLALRCLNVHFKINGILQMAHVHLCLFKPEDELLVKKKRNTLSEVANVKSTESIT